MTDRAGIIFFLVLSGNAAGVLVYGLFCHFSRKGEHAGWGLRCAIMLLIPVLGPFYYFCTWLFGKAFFKRPMDFDAIRPEKEKKEAPSKANEEKEKNMVPLEEAMAVAEKSESRVLVLDIVRRDISRSLSTILLALNSSDSEVAHYAASILQDSLGTFRENVDRMWNMILDLEAGLVLADVPEKGLVFSTEEREEAERKENRHRRVRAESPLREYLNGHVAPLSIWKDEQVQRRERLTQEMALARELITDMGAVLRQKVFTEPEQKAFLRQMELLMELIDFRDIAGAEELNAVCTEETRAGMYDEADVWCGLLLQLYPGELDTWKCALRLSYARGDYATFRSRMEELKQSDVELDEEMIGRIRFFQRQQGA